MLSRGESKQPRTNLSLTLHTSEVWTLRTSEHSAVSSSTSSYPFAIDDGVPCRCFYTLSTFVLVLSLCRWRLTTLKRVWWGCLQGTLACHIYSVLNEITSNSNFSWLKVATEYTSNWKGRFRGVSRITHMVGCILSRFWGFINFLLVWIIHPCTSLTGARYNRKPISFLNQVLNIKVPGHSY